jgi:hypothetical protein
VPSPSLGIFQQKKVRRERERAGHHPCTLWVMAPDRSGGHTRSSTKKKEKEKKYTKLGSAYNQGSFQFVQGTPEKLP